jgi:hypothetical protein
MATLQERLADSLKELQKLQSENGLAISGLLTYREHIWKD